jgi:hypothetical protein
MSENIFGDLDIAGAEDNPFAVPDNMYEAYVTDARVALTKAGDKLGMTLVYTIDGGPQNGKQVSEFKHIPRNEDNMDPDAKARTVSFLKMRLASLGVPEPKMNTLDPTDLIGTACTIVVKTKDGYTNVNKVEVREDTNKPTFA